MLKQQVLEEESVQESLTVEQVSWAPEIAKGKMIARVARLLYGDIIVRELSE